MQAIDRRQCWHFFGDELSEFRASWRWLVIAF